MGLYTFKGISIFILILISVGNKSSSYPTSDHKVRSNALLDFLNIAEKAVNSAKHYIAKGIRFGAEIPHSYPTDCVDIYEQNSSAVTGIYKVWPRNRISNGPLNVYCDMDDDEGAWTVIQRRGNFESAKDYFYRDWNSYKKGFGDLLKDFWIESFDFVLSGNDNIFALTNERANSVKFNLSDWEGNNTYAIYDKFWIDDEDHNYTMHVSGYRGNAGDGFSSTNSNSFSTQDMNNDKSDTNWATYYKGAWWYGSGHLSNLNGQYLKGLHGSYGDGVNWLSFRGNTYSLKDTWIKIRPNNYRKSSKINITLE